MSRQAELINRTLDLVEKTLVGGPMKLKPEPCDSETIGILNGMSHAAYLELPYISKSGLDYIHQTPAHFKEYKENPPKETPALEFGRAFHEALLLPGQFERNYIMAPDLDRRTRAGKEAWAAIAQTERTPLKPEIYDQILGMVDSVRRHPEAKSMIDHGETEISCVWRDPGQDVLCKCRPDLILPSGIIVDIKTTKDASLNAFMRSIAKYRYHVQAAFYLDGISTFEKVDKFVFIAVEKSPPYGVAVYALDEGAIDKGMSDYRKDLETYATCLRANRWPGYPTDIMNISLPHSAFWEE